MSEATLKPPSAKVEKPGKPDSPSNPHYRGPYVELGLPVLWYPQGNRSLEPTAATVTRVGNENVCVNLLSHELKDMPLRDGVFHVSDPRSRKPDTLDNGAWDYCPWWKLIQRLAQEMGFIDPVK